MWGLGKLLSLPVKIANVPFRVIEKVVGHGCGQDDIPESERILSMPLEKLSESIEEIDKGTSHD